jgi:hypothetical protein
MYLRAVITNPFVARIKRSLIFRFDMLLIASWKMLVRRRYEQA